MSFTYYEQYHLHEFVDRMRKPMNNLTDFKSRIKNIYTIYI